MCERTIDRLHSKARYLRERITSTYNVSSYHAVDHAVLHQSILNASNELDAEMAAMIAAGEMSRDIASKIKLRCMCLGLQKSSYRDCCELIQITDLDELDNATISVVVIPDRYLLAEIRRRSRTRWTITISAGLFEVVNAAVLALVDPEWPVVPIGDRVNHFAARVEAAFDGVHFPRHAAFSPADAAKVEKLGSFVKMFIIGHELGHIIAKFHPESCATSHDTEFFADLQGWHSLYSKIWLLAQPFRQLYESGRITNNWDRWNWIKSQAPGEDPVLAQQLIFESLTQNERADNTMLHSLVFLAPHIFFRAIDYHEWIMTRRGYTPATHPPSLARRARILSIFPRDLAERVRSDLESKLDARIPPPK
ncbi:MAG: hypothetical protein CMJ35_02465 [Phycisphaerae bacterium]|nr:hypothetical protein [Phycisphaerae bacterium]